VLVVLNAPGETRLAASLPNGVAIEAPRREGGWTRTGDVASLWSNDLTSPEPADAYDPAKREQVVAAIDTWADASRPEWFTSEPG
jgi:hypothetical protein